MLSSMLSPNVEIRESKSRQENPRESESDDLPGNDIPTVAGAEDLRVLGYLPDSQNLQVGSASIEVSSLWDRLLNIC